MAQPGAGGHADRADVTVTAGTLEDALRLAGREVETPWTGENPTERQIAAAARAQPRHDITVVVTGYLGADRRQRHPVRRLRQGGRTIIISARSPYDVTWFRFAGVQVAAYGSARASMRALARIIEGEIGPSGRSPSTFPPLVVRGQRSPSAAARPEEAAGVLATISP